MLADVFRKNKINLLYGESGSGKTISTIKALNKEGIEPLLFDFDDNDSPMVNNCSYLHIDGYKALADKTMVIPQSKFSYKARHTNNESRTCKSSWVKDVVRDYR